MDNGDQKARERDLFWIDHPATTEWVGLIGKLLLNFGSIELMAFAWLAALSNKNDIVLDLVAEMALGRRIKLILDLIPKSELASSSCNIAEKRWKEVQKLSDLRNRVAHNPIVFGWHGAEENGAPKFIGIPNMKKRSIDRLVDLVTLKQAVDQTARIAQHLNQQLAEIWKIQEHL